MKKRLAPLLFSVFCLSGTAAAGDQFGVLSVSDTTLNNRPAVSVYFGETQDKYCTATIYKTNVKMGYSVQNIQRNNPDFNIHCSFNGEPYVLSSKHFTMAGLGIKELDNNNKHAVIRIVGALVSVRSGKYYETITDLEITGDTFAKLTKQ